MSVFPEEFDTLLSPRSRTVLEEPARLQAALRANRFVWLKNVLDARVLQRAIGSLDRELFQSLRVISGPIADDSILRMKENYSELLNKTMHFRTAFLKSTRSRSFAAASQLGLIHMLRSPSMAKFAETVTGLPLRRPCDVQVICYGDGDYAGPHNDHHPEDAGFRNGYVDIHLTLSHPRVAHQYLVYERRGHLSQIVNIAESGGIAVYQLPFWHYTTPLVAQRGWEHAAHRWLLLATFEIAQRAPRRFRRR